MVEHVIILLENGSYTFCQLVEDGNHSVVRTVSGYVNPNIVLRQPMHSSESDTSSQCTLPKSNVTVKWTCPSDRWAKDRIEVIHPKYNKTIEEVEISHAFGLKSVVVFFNKYEKLNEVEILDLLIKNLIK
jgi:hypothetical protein